MLETNTDPDPDPIQYGSRALMSKNWKKITAENFFKNFFLSKTTIYLSLGLHKVCPSYRRSLQFTKEAIQHFKTWTFTNYCLLLWVIFSLLDPDPDSEYWSGSGSTSPIEYGPKTDPDPDPQHCLQLLNFNFDADSYPALTLMQIRIRLLTLVTAP